jgi:hypothetical protein
MCYGPTGFAWGPAFTIYKFFQFGAGWEAPATQGLIRPRGFAMILAGIALVTLLLAAISHRKQTGSQAGAQSKVVSMIRPKSPCTFAVPRVLDRFGVSG